jgi:hypothetical protein
MDYENIVVIQMKQIFGNYKFKGKYKFGKTTTYLDTRKSFGIINVKVYQNYCLFDRRLLYRG